MPVFLLFMSCTTTYISGVQDVVYEALTMLGPCVPLPIGIVVPFGEREREILAPNIDRAVADKIDHYTPSIGLLVSFAATLLE